jgi:hypothetical protein
MSLRRRDVLRGAGVALALPFMESLAPRVARAAAPAPRRRFVAMNFPNGVASAYWKPHAQGAGSAWLLSPILEPLAPVKSKVTVLGNVGNYGPFGGHIEPSHAHNYASFLTCTKTKVMNSVPTVGISVDQVIANGIGAATKIPSLQLGLSTLDSFTDGLPGPCSRAVSWNAQGEPMAKVVDPQAVFDRLVAAGPVPGPVQAGADPAALERRAANKSVLDYVLAHATTVRTNASRGDRLRMDKFLTSVRELEKNVGEGTVSPACSIPTRSPDRYGVNDVPLGYNRDVHANQMIDLTVMALQCDLTRVVTFALDDARSDFVYSFLPVRQFTPTGSTPATGTVGNAHGVSSTSDTNDAYATLSFWFVEKLSRLCQKLAAAEEGDTGNVLDKSVVWFGSEMHGGNHDGLDLPVLYVGSGGGRLKVDLNVDFKSRPSGGEALANVYLTFIRNVFDLPATRFGIGMGNLVADGTSVVPELIAPI